MVYQNCKFGEFCRFHHGVIESLNDSKEMEEIRKNLDDLRNRILEKEREIKIKDDEMEQTTNQESC